MDQQKNEAQLLAAMAAAPTLEEQRRLASQLEAQRAEAKHRAEAERAYDWAGEFLSERMASVETYDPRSHTAGTDWLNDVEIPDGDPAVAENTMRAEASVWHASRHPEVLADPRELLVQAHALASRRASQFGVHASKAREAFLEQVRHLAGITTGAWGDDEAPENPDPPQPGHDEYGGTGSSLPKTPQGQETHDTGFQPGSDPDETETSASDTPSLNEGDEPEDDQAVSADGEAPHASDTNNDAASWDRYDGDSTVASRKTAAADWGLYNGTTINGYWVTVALGMGGNGDEWYYDIWPSFSGSDEDNKVVGPVWSGDEKSTKKAAEAAASALPPGPSTQDENTGAFNGLMGFNATGSRKTAISGGDTVVLTRDDEDPDAGVVIPEGTVLVVDQVTATDGEDWIYATYDGQDVVIDPDAVRVASRKRASRKTAALSAGDKATVDGKTVTVRSVSGDVVEVEDEYGAFWSEQAKDLTLVASRRTAADDKGWLTDEPNALERSVLRAHDAGKHEGVPGMYMSCPKCNPPGETTASRKTAARFSSYEELEKYVRGLMAQHPDLVAAAEAAYGRQDQSWFDAQDTATLKILWEIAASSFFVSWDDEVYDALADRPGGFDAVASRRKTAAERPVNYPYNSASGIYDAQAFTVEGNPFIHQPVDYPVNADEYAGPFSHEMIFSGQPVVAKCGVIGEATRESSTSRFPYAEWASGYGDNDQWCPTCFGGRMGSRKTAAEWRHEPAQELDLGIGHYPADRWTLTRGEASAHIRATDPAAGVSSFRWSVDASPTNTTVDTGSAQSLDEAKAAAEAALDRLSTTASHRQAAEGNTCSVCGDKIAKDPEGGGYHHDNGEKHDHEAKPSGNAKESTAALTDADKAKVIPPMGYEVTRADVEAAMALPSGSRPRIYAYWDNGTGNPQVVKITSQHYLDEYGPDVEFYWGTNASMDNIGDWMVSRASHTRKTAAQEDIWGAVKTAISLTNIGVESDTVGTGTDPSGKRVRFSITPAEAKQLKDILYSDMAINFSGVDVEESDIIKEGGRKTALSGCSCAHNTDGSVTTMLCPVHASEDPCWTYSRVTGKRRKGSIVRGVCTNCGWAAKTASRKSATWEANGRMFSDECMENGVGCDGWIDEGPCYCGCHSTDDDLLTDGDVIEWHADDPNGYTREIGSKISSRKTASHYQPYADGFGVFHVTLPHPNDEEALSLINEALGERGYGSVESVDGTDNGDGTWTYVESGEDEGDVLWRDDMLQYTHGGRRPRHHAVDQADKPCASCGRPVGWLEVFPNFGGEGILCIDCYSRTPEGRRMPTSDELTRMWGGPVRQGSRKQASDGWVSLNSGDSGAVRDIYEKVLPGGDSLEVSVDRQSGRASWNYVSREGYFTGGSGTEATLEAAKAAAEASLGSANAGHGPAIGSRREAGRKTASGIDLSLFSTEELQQWSADLLDQIQGRAPMPGASSTSRANEERQRIVEELQARTASRHEAARKAVVASSIWDD